MRVEGAGPVLATLAEIALPVRPGDEVNPDELSRLAEAVRSTGYFESVAVEFKDGVLLVRVRPYPKIAEVKIEARAFAPEKLAAYLADQLALESKRQGKNVIALGPGCRRLGEGS